MEFVFIKFPEKRAAGEATFTNEDIGMTKGT